jgi:membrane-associated phospholipid phosphatase
VISIQNGSSQFESVRNGTLRLLNPEFLNGIIQFPSYHTILAVLIAAAFKGLPRLFPWVVLLEAIIIFTTRGIGGHFYLDIVAGLAIAFATIWAATRLMEISEAHPIRIAGMKLPFLKIS